MTHSGRPSPDPGTVGTVLRVVALLVLVIAAIWASHMLREALDLQIRPENEQQVHRAIMLGAVAYVGLLAVPFVPGAEIGIAMLTAFGAAIAPLIYSATVLAMLLAYALGRMVPVTVLARLLSFLRMRRAADLISRSSSLTQEERVAFLLEGAPPGMIALALRHRYVALALSVNVPGNAVIGGGGGIMMLAGMSGIFAPIPTALSVMIAVSPVPVAVMLAGL